MEDELAATLSGYQLEAEAVTDQQDAEAWHDHQSMGPTLRCQLNARPTVKDELDAKPAVKDELDTKPAVRN